MRKKGQAAIVLACAVILFAGAFSFAEREKEKEEAKEEPVTIQWYVALEDYSKEWNPSENVSDAKILEETGVALDIQSGSLTDLDALIATDSLPDLITVEAGTQEQYVLENSGMAAALDPLFAQYAPDNQIPESMKEWYRNTDGNWYGIASYYYGPERVNEEYGGFLGSHNYNFVRSDLQKEIGVTYEELQTKEGMLYALRAAKNLEYQGQPVIPYSGWWTESIAGQFGMQIEDENGQLLSAYRQPEWLEALLFGNQMYREGLMSSEEFTESANQRRLLVESGRVFCVTGYANVKDAKESLKSKDPEAAMLFAGYIHGDAGNPPNLKTVPAGGWTVTLVNADAQNMERIISFIDYMTTDEGTLNAAPEIGAGTYDIIDGICVRKPEVEQEFAEDYEKASEKYYLNLEFFVDWTVIQKYQGRQERIAVERQLQGCNVYDSKALDAAKYIDESNPLAETKEKIEAYYKKAEVEILTSESAQMCRQRYEETIAVMESMGLSDLEAYEKRQYQEAKEKLAN